MAGTFAGKGGERVGEERHRLREGREGFSKGVKGEGDDVGSDEGRDERVAKEFVRVVTEEGVGFGWGSFLVAEEGAVALSWEGFRISEVAAPNTKDSEVLGSGSGSGTRTEAILVGGKSGN
ncbi:hypothetical protein Rs2_05932 [Raphanus sativus]|nr:hypothetical protein Rs2_05932 [Raphanus sativus]